MTSTVFAVTAVVSAVHDMHIDAVIQYANQSGRDIRRVRSGWRGVVQLARFVRAGDTVFLQSTGLPNLLYHLVIFTRKARSVYYLHEPTSLNIKLRNGDPLSKALVMHAVQIIDCLASRKIMVSSQRTKSDAEANFPGVSGKCIIGPLLLPPPAGPKKPATRVTYIGRIDERRYFSAFLGAAERITALGMTATVLTGDSRIIRYKGAPGLEHCDVIYEAHFSESEKARVISETLLVWNPKSVSISQSGVSADALRYGIPVILTSHDPYYDIFLSNSLCIPFRRDDPVSLDVIEEALKYREADFSRLFSSLHGFDAFMAHYYEAMQGND